MALAPEQTEAQRFEEIMEPIECNPNGIATVAGVVLRCTPNRTGGSEPDARASNRATVAPPSVGVAAPPWTEMSGIGKGYGRRSW